MVERLGRGSQGKRLLELFKTKDLYKDSDIGDGKGKDIFPFVQFAYSFTFCVLGKHPSTSL